MSKNSRTTTKYKLPRSQLKNLAINKRGNLGSKRWKIDFDYTHQLNEEEKRFLNDFTEEYYIANFKKNGDGTYKSRFLKSKKARRKSWYENNVSNRCVMSLNGVQGKVTTQELKGKPSDSPHGGVNEFIDFFTPNKDEIEDTIIDRIDFKTSPEVLRRLEEIRKLLPKRKKT